MTIRAHPIFANMYTADSPLDFVGWEVTHVEAPESRYPIIRMVRLKDGLVIRCQAFKAIIPYQTYQRHLEDK